MKSIRRNLSMTAIVALILFSGAVLAQIPGELPDNAVWIDVRTPQEYQQGHLSGATLIPWDGIEKGVAELNLPKDTPIYLYCAVGGRAGKAKERLEARDYSHVVNVGGLADARKLAGENSGPD